MVIPKDGRHAGDLPTALRSGRVRVVVATSLPPSTLYSIWLPPPHPPIEGRCINRS